MITSIDPQAAAWIRANVLNRHRHLAALVDACACQWGICGHCGAGRHKDCTAANHPPRQAVETYLTARHGGLQMALAQVRKIGTQCRWICPCACPKTTRPVQLALNVPTGQRRGPGAKPRAVPKPRPALEQTGLFDLPPVTGAL